MVIAATTRDRPGRPQPTIEQHISERLAEARLPSAA
jgi:hypothetical protein